MSRESVDKVAQSAQKFRLVYYGKLDNRSERHLIMNYYDPNIQDLCEWNGHKLNYNGLQQYLSQLENTKHEIDSLDAQPLPGNEGSDSFILVVHGKVTYNDEHKREFYQRMIIRKEGNEDKYFVINDYYRWLSEP
ncbi:NTF2-related export protein 1/2 [Angomonas deanei]|uniref:NTF2-related export protein n=1 Tax=Angomonas deanei TaxID=59799 RepID=A0A7G2CJ47_9TRYP|nr:NTF2-related export protein 1/2 [Angomonas deanei]CAD2219077.1 Nuclear transport factor 2 (NTF2) domain containing protein, putative [Angomonas deanei]|eukprot:EPY39291.1 NTF2-related export protein 1/2 [Angomonas deanei]